LLKKEAPYQESRPSQGKDQRTPDRPNHVAEPIVYSSAHSATNAFLSFLLPVSLSHHMKEIMVACFYQPFFFEQEREIRDPWMLSSFAVKHETEVHLDQTPGTRNTAATHNTPEYFRAGWRCSAAAAEKEAPQEPRSLFFGWAFAWHYAATSISPHLVFRVRETYSHQETT
jgi:hypothetical protein